MGPQLAKVDDDPVDFLREYINVAAPTAFFLLFTMGVVWLGGGVRWICATGVCWMGNFYNVYLTLQQRVRSVEYTAAHRPNHLLILAALAGFIKLIQSFDVYLVLNRTQTLTASLATFPWQSSLPYFTVPLVVGVIARHHLRTLSAPHVSGRFVAFVFGAGLVFNFYLMICGLWGIEAFEAARQVLTLPDFFHLPSSLETYVTAGPGAGRALYSALGPYAFYTLFVVLPLYWFLSFSALNIRDALGALLKKDSRYYAGPLRSAFVARLWILVLGLSVGNAVGDVDRVYYGWLRLGHPIDRQLFACKQSVGQDSVAMTQCLQVASASWSEEVDRMNAQVFEQLLPQRKQAFRVASQSWRVKLEKYLAQLANDPARKAEESINASKRRVTELAGLLIN